MASESLLDDILRKAVALGASDVHVHAKTPILMRVHGHLKSFGEVLEPTRADAVVRSLLVDSQREVLDDLGQLDFAYEIAGVARFRCNAYRQHNGTDVTLRVIPPDPPSLDQLGLPAALRTLADFHNGLVLVTGPSGCGKSSTLAALVNIVNHERRDHILTIEDPIEYVHESAQCVVNQREVLRHTESFARALRAALREDPDIIAIGELRDLETISLAITAAETGHLVFGTLHTHDTISTIDRLIGVFQPEEQPQIRTMLSESLRAVVSQRLVPRADGKGRVPALEILMNNRAVGNLIRADKTFQLGSVLQTGAAQGMVLLDDSLAQLVEQGTVARDVAVRFATEPSKFPA
ncbi:MAG: type IV pilus twitching motility protein PilT [Gemmatimonadetes bacterium]|nr:type IV pilus twitching motility protein PilT [Gemmatimonadota bacterium]MCH8810875.1 type IV pilus twitching motility protein PilT [Gemmatimonadota bacterium]